MKRSSWTWFFVVAVMAAAGCEKAPAEAQAEAPNEALDEAPAEAQAEAEPTPEAAEQPAPAALAKVAVEPDGTRFDPPVQPEQLPDHVWYCDMGTVHYARLEQGDGSCAECGMKLKEYDPAQHAEMKAKAVEAHEHEGHDHGAHDDHADHGQGDGAAAHDDAHEGHAH